MKAQPFRETALLKRVGQLLAWPERMLFLDRAETAAVYLRGVLLVAQHSRAHEAPAEGLDLFALGSFPLVYAFVDLGRRGAGADGQGQ